MAKLTTAWFSRRAKDNFEKFLKPLADQPVTYIEIGVFEGASATWICENVLTHPDSRGYGIDPWPPTRKRTEEQMDEIHKRAIENLEPYAKKFELIKSSSTDVLRSNRFKPNSADVIYIDGMHFAPNVMTDAVQAFIILKVGGIMIFDDYSADIGKHGILCVKPAVDAFILTYNRFVEILGTSTHQKILRKTKELPC